MSERLTYVVVLRRWPEGDPPEQKALAFTDREPAEAYLARFRRRCGRSGQGEFAESRLDLPAARGAASPPLLYAVLTRDERAQADDAWDGDPAAYWANVE